MTRCRPSGRIGRSRLSTLLQQALQTVEDDVRPKSNAGLDVARTVASRQAEAVLVD
jgi:hypothetical protein